MKTAPKSTKKIAPPRDKKDGYGAHWHSVGWLAAIAVVLSASTMTLSASAQTTTVTPSTLLRSLNDLRAQLTRVESKIDRLDAKINTLSVPPAPAPAPTTNAIVQPIDADVLRLEISPQLVEPVELLSDTTKCRLACEDEFNACAKQTNTKTTYEVCKQNYESCYFACGQ